MNVLLLYPMADGQTGPAIQHALEKLGHNVLAMDAKLELDRRIICSCGIEFKPDLIFCSRNNRLRL